MVHETGHAVYGDNEDTANYIGSRFTDTYTDGLWINGIDSNLGTWTPGIKNPFYVKQNTSDFSQVKNRDDFILSTLIIGGIYIGGSYIIGDGDLLEGNKRIKNMNVYKYTFGAINDATAYVVGKGIEGTDYLLNKTGITNSEYYLSEQIGKGLKWYENNVSEKTRNYIGYVGDVTNVALIGASIAKIIDKAVNKTISATKSVGSKLSKSIDKTVDGMTIDFGDTLPKEPLPTYKTINNEVVNNIRSGTALSKSQPGPNFDKYHGFNDIIDNYASYAKKFDHINNDGTHLNLYQIEGSLSGKDGIFEWLVSPDPQKGVIHRLFIENGKVTGKLNIFK